MKRYIRSDTTSNDTVEDVQNCPYSIRKETNRYYVVDKDNLETVSGPFDSHQGALDEIQKRMSSKNVDVEFARKNSGSTGPTKSTAKQVTHTYSYRGSAYKFNKSDSNYLGEFTLTTTAVNKGKAISNIKYRIRNIEHLNRTTPILLDDSKFQEV